MIVGLISTYLEGRTAQHAIRTALQACDRVIVCEGPAGPPLEVDVPPTDLGEYAADPRVTQLHGRWRTDARKRTWMLGAIRSFPKPVWGLWLDGDEVLINPEYLRDWTDWIAWNDNPDQPTLRLPLRLVELDGSISMSYVKLLRVDLVKSYEVSISNLTNMVGIEERAGNLHEHLSGWAASHPRAGEGYLYWPPGPAPCDPYIVHRSMLRHPARAGLRLHDQERVELDRIGIPESDGK